MASIRHTLTIALALLTAGCSAHSYPQSETFIVPQGSDLAAVQRAEVFVDAYGTFYPDNWSSLVPRPRPWREDELLTHALRVQALGETLGKEEPRQLADIAKFARWKSRIFILVHGYNNTAEEAERPFDQIEARLDLRPGDGVLRFHWDGLTGSGIGGGEIWFSAANYSRLAGARGLRRVLAQMRGKQVYLISHSRGASVILSALGNGVHNPGFVRKVREKARGWGIDADTFLWPKELEPALLPGETHVLLMAPAIDMVDFCARADQGLDHSDGCRSWRPLGDGVHSLRYTVNPGDPVLNKFLGLGGHFNPTRLGLQPWVGEEIARRGSYRAMEPFAFEHPQGKHKFDTYVRHRSFARMLAAAGILKPGIHTPAEKAE